MVGEYEVKKIPWKQCKDICTELYFTNKLLTPYQEYGFLDTVGLGRKETNPLCTIGFKESTYVLYKDSNPEAVLSLYINRHKKLILLRGHYSIMAHLDMISASKLDLEGIAFLFQAVKSNYPGYKLVMDRISEKSSTCRFLLKERFVSEDNKTKCVSIPFTEGYDAWFSGLKKSFKQDIRSGYNRLRTDNKDYKFEFDFHSSPDKKAISEILRLYSKRACEHSGIENKAMSRLVQMFLRITKKNNPFNKALEKSNRYIGGRIYIDGRLVAYCQALQSNDGRVIVPKLSIDLDYKRYNLGGLLINYMIKNLSNVVDSTGCTELDLSRGDERYKYDYGGHDHFNYEAIIDL